MNNYNKYWFMYCDARESGQGLGGRTHEQALAIIEQEMKKDGLSDGEMSDIVRRINREYEDFSQKATYEMD